MKNLHYLLLAFLFFQCQSSKQEDSKGTSLQAATQKPNIIFIMADDMGYGDAGCYGQQIIQTPHIDNMAKEGIKFTQHYAGNTVCAPSRCALMTGKHMGHAEIRGNGLVEPYGQPPITADAITVAELLKSAGYTTGMIGKWGLGIIENSGNPMKQGFDFFYGYLDQVLAHNYFPEYLMRNDKKEYLKNKVVYQDSSKWHKGYGSHSIEQVEYSHDLFANEALKFIETNKDNPFFLYLPFTIPHDNGEAPEGQRQEVPDFGPYADQDWNHDTKAYAAMITRMDKDIGRIMEKLKHLGIDENTIVFFTSDNGPMPGEDFTEFFNSNGALRGGKRDMYEGGIREPFVARWPGKIKPGTVTDHMSAFWDFLPTACEIAGIEAPSDTDGISYLPVLKEGSQEKQHEYLYWQFPEQGYKEAIRKGKWKGIRLDMKKNPENPLELYNLEEDPGEEHNIADQYPEIVSELEGLIQKAHVPSERFPKPGDHI
ncbi:arylsulfatase [Flexithrix dorotheae]|uniref:arylsulfatase n=1 Tax=Flexithrix dorotheae TaxID=70993 RepID=UPI00037915CF|nr:arylsulfatase [Flexithrix dorotheae]